MADKPEPPEEKISLGYIDEDCDQVLFSIDKPAIHNKHGGDMLQFALSLSDLRSLKIHIDDFFEREGIPEYENEELFGLGYIVTQEDVLTELTQSSQDMGMYDTKKTLCTLLLSGCL